MTLYGIQNKTYGLAGRQGAEDCIAVVYRPVFNTHMVDIVSVFKIVKYP